MKENKKEENKKKKTLFGKSHFSTEKLKKK